MSSEQPVIGVVLAGGQSSRMGSDKALLSFAEQTMLETMKQRLKQTSVTKVVVSRNDKVAAHFADIVPSKGPLSGIHSIAMRFPLYSLLVVPVDLPLLDVKSIQQLIDRGTRSQQNTRFKGHNLPLFVHNSDSLRLALDFTLKNTNAYSVHRFCEQFPMIEQEIDDSDVLFNTNTPNQWYAAMERCADMHSNPSRSNLISVTKATSQLSSM